METITKLWQDFADVPIDSNDCIEIEWHGFEKGTDKMTIWHWFDDNSNGLYPTR